MKIYLVRHGSTDWVGHKFQGQTITVPLNQLGHEQAEQTAKKLKNVNFTACYCSPCQRAQQTAEHIIKNHPGLAIQTDQLLIERGFGELEGKSNIVDFNYADYWDILKDLHDRGIESVCHLLERANKFAAKIRKTHQASDTILVVAHGSLNKALYYNITGYDEATDMLSFHLDPAEFIVLEN